MNTFQIFVFVLVVEHCSVSKSCNFLIFWRIAVALRDFPTDRQITRHTRTNIYLFVSNSLQRAFLCVSICGFLAAGERVSKWLTATLEFWTQRATFEDLGPSDIWCLDKKTIREQKQKESLILWCQGSFALLLCAFWVLLSFLKEMVSKHLKGRLRKRLRTVTCFCLRR